jgi:hypothetical protein
VQIDWSKIQEGKEINFEILDAGVENYGEYDYGSIMHYGAMFFSSTGEPVITVPDGIDIGQRIALSDKDIAAVDLMYATDIALAVPVFQETDEGVEIDVTINNLGELGAHNLQLLARLGDDSNWQGISQESGWDCLTFGAELNCSRNTFGGQSESRFTLLIDPGAANTDDLALTLTARTMDTDLSNNGFNDQSVEWQSIESGDGANSGDTGDQTDRENLATNSAIDQPGVGAAEPENQASNQSTASTITAGAGGPIMLSFLMTIAGWRMCRRSKLAACGTPP